MPARPKEGGARSGVPKKKPAARSKEKARRRKPGVPVPADHRDATTGEAMFKLHAREALRAAEGVASLPTVNVSFITERHLWVLRNHIDPRIKLVAAILAIELRRRVLNAYGRQRSLNHALHYAYTHFLLQRAPAEKRPGIASLIEEGRVLDALLDRWLRVLVAIGQLDAQLAKDILDGTSTDDMVSDLLVGGPLLWEKRDVIAEMQRVLADETMRITPEQIQRMSELGTLLRDAFAGPDAAAAEGIDWRRQVIGLFSMLEQDYMLVRHAVRFYLRITGDDAEIDVLNTLRGMNQLGRARPETEEAGEADEQPAEPEATEPVAEDGETEDDEDEA